jgi:nucleotide-binding universal stress UspA family protein
MIDIKRILVPVDFSEPSKTAVNYGLSLALQFNARLILTHIVPSNVGIVYTFPTESFAYTRAEVDYAKTTLPTLVPEEYRERVNLDVIVKAGALKDELLAIVNESKIDLVVMGTHGRNAFERFMLGSLTERMLRKLTVPVLTVSHLDPAKELHSAGPVSLRKILYATDLSDSADVGLKVALDLARGAGARLTVLHVLKALETVYWGSEGGFLTNELDVLRQDTFTRLKLSIPDEWSEDVDVTPMMVEGDAYREILRIADEEKMDLVVLNLQGKSVVERALLGSTAERVIRSAHMPVLSIPVPVGYTAAVRETKSAVA